MDDALHLLVEWVTSAAIARGSLPHPEGIVEMEIEAVDAAVSELEAMVASEEGAFDA